MSYECKEITMSDGNVNFFHCWTPDSCSDNDGVKCVVLLSHGMVEYAFRYDHLAKFFNENGIAFYGEDHRGHGKTAQRALSLGTGMFGFLAEKDGFFRVVDDIKEEVDFLRKLYPGKKLFLFAHSFGSFIGQCFIEKYGSSIDGIVLSGTAGPRFIVSFGKFFATVVKNFAGARHVSKFIEKLSFSGYPDDWLSRDIDILQKYKSDPWCTFPCTVGFYCDMFEGLCYIHKKSCMKSIIKQIPVLLLSGTKDPVGSNGKTVQKLYSIYNSNGMENVQLKLVEDGRHELVNDICRDEIMSFVLEWIGRFI